jgi:hypothetical protein
MARSAVARRLDGGQRLREAIDASGLTLQGIAARTRADGGKGLSFQLIAFLASDRDWARETTSPDSGVLIEDALSVPRGSLFEYN